MRRILNMVVGVTLLSAAFPRPLEAGIMTALSNVEEMALPASMSTPWRGLLDEHTQPLMGWMLDPRILLPDMDQNKFLRFNRPIELPPVMLESPRVDFQKIRIHAGSGDIISNDAMVSAPMVRKKAESRAQWETMIAPDTATLLLLAAGSLLFLCDRRWRLGLSK